ncbi:MAG: DNA primase, partial [SAR202 cluster bacterium]|nr:DNA primase [SAR202 cluster bacterium]
MPKPTPRLQWRSNPWRGPVASSGGAGVFPALAISDDIKARLDIVDVVQRYVPDLRQAGRNFAARCPFHAERTPSFYVFPERQSWRCFGACATGGDAFSFVMKAENVDFGEALKRLAAIAGVTIPDKRRPEAPRNPLLDANDAAARLFRESLLADRGAVARDYLKQRGVNDESVATFGLGYSPATGDELQHRLRAMGFSQDLLIEAGLLTRGDTGPIRDMFRGRLMFAIRNDRGEIVGFGGRSLDGSNPKYLNTPQTTVFDKGKLLFALDRAREAIRREGRAVVVEGYMDAIAAHQHGFRNVVASMGTALTDSQANALRGSGAAQIVLALDADAAGQEAMLRSLHSVWQLLGQSLEGIRRAGSLEIKGRSGDLDRLRVAVVPEGKDPDDMIRRDPAAWNRLI